MTFAAPKDDRGSVLILGAGLIAVCFLGLTVLTDASAAFLQRQHLQSLADGAALAGAQAIDLDSYYANGAERSTQLDRYAVQSAVRRHIGGWIPRDEETGLVIERISTDGRRVVVGIRAPLDLPFLDDLFPADVRVEASAQLSYVGEE